MYKFGANMLLSFISMNFPRNSGPPDKAEKMHEKLSRAKKSSYSTPTAICIKPYFATE